MTHLTGKIYTEKGKHRLHDRHASAGCTPGAATHSIN